MAKTTTTPNPETETAPVLTATERKTRELEVSAAIARFAVFHGALRGTGAMMKLARYFAGLEVQTLRGLFHDLYGETRGGTGEADITLGEWLEDKLQVTERTARRHLDFFQGIAMHRPEIADKLNAWWTKNRAGCLEASATPAKASKAKKPTKKAAAAASAALVLMPAPALQSLCIEAAAILQDLLMHEDETDIHGFFELPMKNAGGDETNTAPPEAPSKKHKLVMWWTDFQRRAISKEWAKLPKGELETLKLTVDEMHAELSDILAKKTAAKKAA
jgi:hypothetical protein